VIRIHSACRKANDCVLWQYIIDKAMPRHKARYWIKEQKLLQQFTPQNGHDENCATNVSFTRYHVLAHNQHYYYCTVLYYYLALTILLGQLSMVYAFTTHFGCSWNICTMLHKNIYRMIRQQALKDTEIAQNTRPYLFSLAASFWV